MNTNLTLVLSLQQALSDLEIKRASHSHDLDMMEKNLDQLEQKVAIISKQTLADQPSSSQFVLSDLKNKIKNGKILPDPSAPLVDYFNKASLFLTEQLKELMHRTLNFQETECDGIFIDGNGFVQESQNHLPQLLKSTEHFLAEIPPDLSYLSQSFKNLAVVFRLLENINNEPMEIETQKIKHLFKETDLIDLPKYTRVTAYRNIVGQKGTYLVPDQVLCLHFFCFVHGAESLSLLIDNVYPSIKEHLLKFSSSRNIFFSVVNDEKSGSAMKVCPEPANLGSLISRHDLLTYRFFKEAKLVHAVNLCKNVKTSLEEYICSDSTPSKIELETKFEKLREIASPTHVSDHVINLLDCCKSVLYPDYNVGIRYPIVKKTISAATKCTNTVVFEYYLFLASKMFSYIPQKELEQMFKEYHFVYQNELESFKQTREFLINIQTFVNVNCDNSFGQLFSARFIIRDRFKIAY